MKRLKSKRVLTAGILLATIASAAPAQNAGRVLEGPGARARAVPDSTAAVKAEHNWFVSLLRKIARRSDEIAADSAAASDSPTDADVVATEAPATARAFKSRKDSLAWEAARSTALKSEGYRITVDLFDKTLRVVDGNDTLRVAPAATAMNATLTFGKQVWRFETPRGVRTVRGKDKDPVWTPPDWHFAEVALEHGLKLTALHRNRVVKLKDGTKLLTKGDEVGIIRPGSTVFEPMILDEHVVFDNTLFIPPQGTKHRVIKGELGHFRLDMGNGYLLHGTPYAKSIGSAVTHGCIRLHDEDIEWLYDNVPIGTKVYIY